jgi:hypothetical protein
MQISGIDLAAFSRIVATVSAKYGDNIVVRDTARDLTIIKPRCSASVRAVSSRGEGARLSRSYRHMPAACWHVYRDILIGIFDVNPDTVVRTLLTEYRGKSGFESNYPPTARQNIGSEFMPVTMPELCECSYSNRFGEGTL